MKKFTKAGALLGFSALFFGSLAQATQAYETPPSVFVENTFGLSAATSFFTTTSNYEPSRGAYTGLLNGEKLTLLNTNLRARFTPSTRFSIFAGTAYAQAAAYDTVPIVQTRTNSAFTNANAGFDWLINTDTVQLTAEILGSYPIDQTSSTQTKPFTNDGYGYFRGGLFAHKAFPRFRTTVFGGVQAPGGSLATLFLYEATFDMRVFKTITAGGGIDGYETLIGDTTSLYNRQVTTAIPNGGSEIFNSFSPAMVEARAWIGYRHSHQFWARVGYAQTINGLHNAAGSSILFSLNFTTRPFDFNPADERERIGPRTMSPDDTLRSFTPDVESTEQGLFDMEGDQPSGQSGRSRRKASPLDETEQLLEKKSK
jgi:hypothetical protein